MRRLLPDTIFSRLFALVVTGIVLSHVATFLLVAVFYGRHHPPPHLDAPPMWHIGPYVVPALPPGLWIGLLMQFLILSIAAWFGARFLVRPMQRLAQASGELADNLYAPPIAEEGPYEARQAAAVFNRMQHKVRTQIEERERFVAAVSHDLRTPLTRVKLRIENLTENYAKHKLRGDITEMAEMLDATLDYLQGRGATEELQLLDVQSLIEAIVEDANAAGRSVTMSGTAFPLFTRPSTLRRCLANLLQNALRYGEHAVVALKDAPDTLTIEVQDDGPGIPPDKLELVFEPFVRLDSSRNKTTGGVGLGLSIARQAAQQCDGELTLRNGASGGLIASVALRR
jgi:protein-histidine pros-kinase